MPTEICIFVEACPSPSKSMDWACSKDDKSKTKMCAVRYVLLEKLREELADRK